METSWGIRNHQGWHLTPGDVITRNFKKSIFITKMMILTKAWRMSPISAQNQNLRWTQLESTSKIMMVDVENSSFGFDLIFEIWISDWFCPVAWGPSDFQIMSPGGECFAPLGALPLAEGERVRSTLLQGTRKNWEHQKSTRNHQKSSFFKMNQNTYGDFLRC